MYGESIILHCGLWTLLLGSRLITPFAGRICEWGQLLVSRSRHNRGLTSACADGRENTARVHQPLNALLEPHVIAGLRHASERKSIGLALMFAWLD